MTKKFVLCLCLLLLTVSAVGQLTTATISVSGATNPGGISDNIAYAAVLRWAVSTQTAATMDQKVAQVNFSNPQDVTTVETNLAQFQAADSTNPNQDQVALAGTFAAQLAAQLTSTGLTEIQNFIGNAKYQINLWNLNLGNGCGQSNLATFDYAQDLYYGTPQSAWDFYGDAYPATPCDCTLTPISSTLTYTTIVSNGTVKGSTETVTQTDANKATSQFADSGDIYSTTYKFVYGSCNNQVVVVQYTKETEHAYTKFQNMGLSGTGGCVMSGGQEVCSWIVAPLCTVSTTPPDYKNPSLTIPPIIRDYDFLAWRSVGECARLDWGKAHSTWTCVPIWPVNIGTANVSSATCTYNP